MLSAAKEKFAGLKEKLGDRKESLKAKFGAKAEEAKAKLAELKEKMAAATGEAKEALAEKLEAAKAKVAEIKESLGDELGAAKEKLGDKVDAVKEKIAAFKVTSPVSLVTGSALTLAFVEANAAEDEEAEVVSNSRSTDLGMRWCCDAG